MFLSTSRTALAGVLGACILFAPAPVRADAKQCVRQNNDGLELRDRHQMLAARDAYRACVAEPDCPVIVRSECDAALTDLKDSIPTLLVAVLDEHGHDLAGATLLVDGRPVAIDGSALEVDPGVHDLTAASGALNSHLQVMAIEKDANRRIEIVLQTPTATQTARTFAAPLPSHARSKTPAYLLGGIAAAGAVSFAYFGLSGHADLGHLDECKPYCDPQDVSRVRSKYLAADISLGVSLAALVGATYWLFSASQVEPPANDDQPALAITATPGSASLTVRWNQ